MLVLAIRTDKPEAEIGLFDGDRQLAYNTWPAHRELSNTIHREIARLLAGKDLALTDIKGIVCFEGPGSFTGLRIGLTVADTLAYGLEVPIIGSGGEGWIERGIERLQAGENDKIALPHYGATVHITTPRK